LNTLTQIRFIWKPIIFLACLVPFALAVGDLFGITGSLSANPVEDLQDRFGNWALRFVMIALSVTPLRKLTGKVWLLRFRRMLGLFAFFYICLHFLTYLTLDAFFDFAYILEDITERTYITLGFSSFVLLMVLAATSTDAMVRRLGGRRWRRLHKLAYVAALGGVLHFLWLVKADMREPLIYLGILLVLFLARLPAVAQRLTRKPGLPAGEKAAAARQIAT